MKSIPIKYLNQITAISSLKVLLAFLAKGESLNKNQFEYSLTDLSSELRISINTVKKGIDELVDLGFISQIGNRESGKTTSYRITLDESNTEIYKEQAQYKIATARSKEMEQVKEIEKDIYSIDFNNLNFYTEDINSFSVVNKNLMMTNEELGKLAQRVIKELFLPLCNPMLPDDARSKAMWFSKQSNFTKRLLMEYRTEQLVAAIFYWTTIAPPDRGISSMYFFRLTQSRSRLTNVMIALNYYKSEYIANAYAYDKDNIEKKINEKLAREKEEKEATERKAEEVASMSSEEFVANMLGRFKLNIKKDD